MAEEPETEDESPSNLRRVISETHAVAQNALARAVIAEHGLTHVSVDDLAGVKDLGEIEERAVALNQERADAGIDALKGILGERGITDVDAAVTQILDGKVVDPTADAVERARHVGAIGDPVRTEDLGHLANQGPALMRYALEQEANKRK